MGAGAQFNVQDKDGYTPLHRVAHSGQKSVSQVLLGAGARVDAQDKNWSTTIHSAALGGSETVAEVAAGDRVDWDTLAPAKDIGKEWLGRGIQVKGEGAGKCPAGMH